MTWKPIVNCWAARVRRYKKRLAWCTTSCLGWDGTRTSGWRLRVWNGSYRPAANRFACSRQWATRRKITGPSSDRTTTVSCARPLYCVCVCVWINYRKSAKFEVKPAKYLKTNTVKPVESYDNTRTGVVIILFSFSIFLARVLKTHRVTVVRKILTLKHYNSIWSDNFITSTK